MKVSTKDILIAFDLQAEKGIKYLESKGYKITFSWRDLSAKSHQIAFTVAGVMKMDMLKIIHEFTTQSLKTGATFEEYKNSLSNRLAAAGFSPNFTAKDKDGKKKTVTLTPSRFQNIFRTNLQSAYNAGRLDSQKKVIEESEKRGEEMYYLYNATVDKRARPSHKKLDGLVLPTSHPIWKKIYPPNGYMCRCSVSLLNKKQLKSLGLEISNGNVSNFEPDEGFDTQPDGALNPDLSGYPKDILTAYKKEQGNVKG